MKNRKNKKTTTLEKKSKRRRGSGKRVHRISIIFLLVTYQIEEVGVMLWVHERVGVSLCVEKWRWNSVNVDYSWESGRIQGLAGQTLLTHWDQRWDCFHWKEFQEWARRAISDFTQRALTTVLIHSQAHTLSRTFKDTVYHANNGVRDTLRSPMSPSTQWLSLSTHLTICNMNAVTSDHQQSG